MSKLNPLFSLIVILVVATACATPPPQEISARADSVVVKFWHGDGRLKVLQDSITRTLGDSVIQAAVLRWRTAYGLADCPMPVWVPVPGAAVEMPVLVPDTSETIPMPTTRVSCFNPLFRPR
jgi:hypothetical protein